MHRFPNLGNYPSEATIESLSNHAILVQLANPRSWIITPTRNEELRLGYDARLVNSKVAAVQYKRLERVSTHSMSCKIDPSQHGTLMSLFSRRAAYYAFSVLATYWNIDMAFAAGGVSQFFENTLFVDAHDIPHGTSTLRLKGGRLYPILGRRMSAHVSVRTGPQWVNDLKACVVGEVVETATEDSVLEGRVPFRFSALVWHR